MAIEMTKQIILGHFRPFRQLWEAFECSEPELLVGKSFGALDDACRALITKSRDEAKRILKTNHEKM
jgi:hypothetical protein